MSADRQTDVRRRLVEVAADLLGEEGPAALSARRLAREAGTSTMAVYTHFGGMPALVRAVVAEGSRGSTPGGGGRAERRPAGRPGRRGGGVPRARAGRPAPLLVMFGSASLGEYRLTEDELEVGLAAFGQLVAVVERVMAPARSGAATRRPSPASSGRRCTAT